MRCAFAILLISAAMGCESSDASEAPEFPKADAEVGDAGCSRRATATPCCLGAEDCVTELNLCGEPCKVCWICRVHTWTGDNRCGRTGPCPDGGVAETEPALAATPAFTPAAGTYSRPVDVTITTATPGAVLYFTTDGTDPNDSSARYAGPITLTTKTTIRALAQSPGFAASEIATVTYVITTADAAASD